MPTPERNRLSDTRHITVVLRLVLDARGKLRHGEVVDLKGQLHCRFAAWRGLSKAVRECVSALGARAAADSLPAPPTTPAKD